VFNAIKKWTDSDFLCHNYILNSLDQVLYKFYSPFTTSKVLWDALDKKYKTEDAGLKKFVVEKFMTFNMIDSKSVGQQIQELQIILHEIIAEGHVISESFQVAAIIGKLPPAWKDFKHYLKHKRKDMSLEDLIVRLKIEEDNHGTERRISVESHRVNMVENEKPSRKRKAPSKNKSTNPNGNSNKSRKKFSGSFYCCGKKGHIASDCRHRKDDKQHQANIAEVITDDIDNLHLST
jgi:hypothetical protein